MSELMQEYYRLQARVRMAAWQAERARVAQAARDAQLAEQYAVYEQSYAAGADEARR